jgi:hypothetical protein
VRITGLSTFAFLACSLGACAEVGDEDELGVEEGEAEGASLPLRFLPGELVVPTAVIQTEVREVFRSEAELAEVLQIENPGIDFAHEWAVFYAPGTTHPDLDPGAQARIDKVALSLTGLTLKVTTALEQNGANCPTRRTRPFLLVAIPIPDDIPPYTRFYRADRTRVCGAATYYDGVPFTAAQAAGALNACNLATSAQLGAAGITGTQRSILLGGRPWTSLALVASRPGIGPATMEKLRALGAGF